MNDITIDNKKMWEYLYRYCYEPREAACILEALKHQGLTIVGGEIVSLDPPVFKIEKGHWYTCIRNLHDSYGNQAFIKDDIYYSPKDSYLIPLNSNVPMEIICPCDYFTLYTGEEKLHEPKFKVGDFIKKKGKDCSSWEITEINNGMYYGHYRPEGFPTELPISEQDTFELIETHPKTVFEEGKWYVCTHKDAEIYCLTKGKVYQAVNLEGIGITIVNNTGTPLAINGFINYFRPATEEEIPYQPKFKVGDKIKCLWKHRKAVVTEVKDTWYVLDNRYVLDFEFEDNWELVPTNGKTKEKELTEFERLLQDEYADEARLKDDGVHHIANHLLSIARKQIVSEIDEYEMVNKFCESATERVKFDSYFFQEGIRATIKEIKSDETA